MKERDNIGVASAKTVEIDDRSVFLEFTTSPDAKVWSMVSAGTSNNNIIYTRSFQPVTGPNAV